jgi:hypothetical protein
LPTLDRLRNRKSITAQQIDVLVNQGRQPGHVVREHWKPLGPELFKCQIDIKRVPENDDIDHKPEGSKLVFLPFPIALAQFASFAVKNSSRQLVAVLAAIQLSQRSPAFRPVVNIGKAVDGFVYAPEFGDSLSLLRGAVINPRLVQTSSLQRRQHFHVRPRISSHRVPGVNPMAVILENRHLPFTAVAPSDAGIFLHQA